MQKIILITGATAGFGSTTAELLTKRLEFNYYRAQKERLEKLKTDLTAKYPIQILPLNFDAKKP